MMSTISLWVNGVERQATITPKMSLLAVLRDQLGLMGTKNGCAQGHCGACTVIVGGKAVRACVYPARQAAGQRVETIEGLSRGGQLHPLQQAFIELGAVQCGFCTPGMIMAAKALLDANPQPTAEQIRRALRHNLCRCTGYERIVAAVQAAAAALAGQPWPKPVVPTPHAPLQAVGQPATRPDARAKVTGTAVYAADIHLPGMLVARVLRSPYPHARLRRVNVDAAQALPGVVAVLTARDVPGAPCHGLERPDWPVLCADETRYVGDAIAVVIAETDAVAAKALSLIVVDAEPLPVIDSPEMALAPDAPLLHAGGNVAKEIHIERGDVTQGFAQADLIVERIYHTPRAEHAFLEPEACVAAVDEEGRLIVWVGSQIPFDDRRQIAASLNLPESQVRVVHTETGGAFGGKEDIAGQIHAALAAWVTRRPVRLVYSRAESLIAHPKRHPATIRLKTGVTRDGRLVALDADIVGDTGAYASLGAHVMTRTATHATGPYEIPHVRIHCRAVYTNNIPAGAFRGFGVPQAAFAIESQMDILAEQLGLSPCEIRRRNAFRVGSVTATGQVLRDGVGLLVTLDQAAVALARYAPEGLAPGVVGGEGRMRRAWGMACAYKNVGLGGGAPDSAGGTVEAQPDGRVLVRAGAAEVGQGLVAVLAQIAAEELGVPLSCVEVLVGDTDHTLDGGPTTASRQSFITGNAVRLAAAAVRESIVRTVARHWSVAAETVICRDGRVIAPDGRAMPWQEAVALARRDGASLAADHIYTPPRTQPLGQGGDMHFAFGYTTQLAEVEVDTETGAVRVLRVIAVHDVGRALNPLGVLGQIEGGVVMGMSLALREEFPQEKGVPLITDLAHYHLPTAADVPEIVPVIVEEPVVAGPYGAKGIGEIPSIPTAPAILNAIYHACGARLYALPATPERVLAALAEGAEV